MLCYGMALYRTITDNYFRFLLEFSESHKCENSSKISKLLCLENQPLLLQKKATTVTKRMTTAESKAPALKSLYDKLTTNRHWPFKDKLHKEAPNVQYNNLLSKEIENA